MLVRVEEVEGKMGSGYVDLMRWHVRFWDSWLDNLLRNGYEEK